MRKVILITILTSIFQLNLIAAEVGTKHEYGLSFLGSYEYEEPKIMNLRSGSQATDNELDNLTLGLEYLEHDMYYDAKMMSASLKYNF